MIIMKLNKIEQSIIESGDLYSPENDLVLPSNICPECGHDIMQSDEKQYKISNVCKDTTFRYYYGKQVIFNCPECKCQFKREIYTEYESKYPLPNLRKKVDDDTCRLIIGLLVALLALVLLIILLRGAPLNSQTGLIAMLLLCIMLISISCAFL